MTMLTTTTFTHRSPTWRRRAIVLLVRLRRALNDWVAAALAYRERQAAIHALRQYDDRELKDIGLYRGQIEDAINEASRMRMRVRLWH